MNSFIYEYAGLKKLLQPGEEVPELFDDPVYQRSSYWVLSTSAIFSKHFLVYGWGEVWNCYLFLQAGFADHSCSSGRPRWIRRRLHDWLRWLVPYGLIAQVVTHMMSLQTTYNSALHRGKKC